MAGNPFDQFDAGSATANPFDRFDGAPTAKPSLVQNITGFMANVNRGLGIGDEMAAGFRTAGNALSGKVRLQDVPADFNASMVHQRQLESDFHGAHPLLAAAGQGLGNVATVAAPVGPGAAAFANGTRLTNALRGATVAGLTGAAFAGADAGTPGERLRAAADAAKPWKNPLTFALGAATGAAARGAPRVAPAPTHASTLEQAGVPLTFGQRGGQLRHRIEDGLESLPLTGSAIRSRKIEGIEGFDRAAMNEALTPINQTVDTHGREGMFAANQHVSDAYNAALDGVSVTHDPQFHADIAAITNDPRLPAAVRQDVTDAVHEFVVDPLQADPSGQSWKRVDSDLNTLRRAADNAAASTPQSLSLRRALDRVQEAHWGLLERQAPQAAVDVGAADAANAAMERVRGAAGSVGTAGRDGLFTASDLNRSVATKGGRAGRRAYGQGTALMQGLSDAGQAVLPSSVPDSGTALRTLITKIAGSGGALAGVGALGGHAVAVPAAFSGALVDGAGAAFYSRPVQNALRASYRSRMVGAPAGVLPPAVAARLAAGEGVSGAAANEKPAIEITIGKSTDPDYLAWRRANGLPAN